MALAQRLMCVTVCHFLNGLAVLLVEWIGNYYAHCKLGINRKQNEIL